MNYKEILTKEAVEQFKKEGATTAVITLYNDITNKVIRDLEVSLAESDKCFAIAGMTALGKAAMIAHFVGREIDGEMWFPFGTLHEFTRNRDKILAEVAAAAKVELFDLKWSFINDH